MNSIEIIADVAEVEVKEEHQVELSLAELDFVGGGSPGAILA